MWQMTTIAALHSLLLLFGFRWPTHIDAGLLVFSGITNAAAQYLWTRALQLAPATAVSPFYYFLLVWALVIGFLVWGDVPTVGLLAGSCIVVASGLLLLWHEAQRRSPARQPSIEARKPNEDAADPRASPDQVLSEPRLPAFSLSHSRR
jgi:drug/metabolite transporter (DMT)-like permease